MEDKNLMSADVDIVVRFNFQSFRTYVMILSTTLLVSPVFKGVL